MTCRVHLPSALDSYTKGARAHDLAARTLAEVFDSLDKRFPGLRFRVVDETGCLREHIKVFVNGVADEDLCRPLAEAAEVHVVLALSGG